jgi:hypothetical protein
MELQGTSCLPLSLIAPQRKGMAVTRTFGLEPTQDSFSLIRDALRGCRSIFRQGFKYWKAGVMLNELIDATTARRRCSRAVILCSPRVSWRRWITSTAASAVT